MFEYRNETSQLCRINGEKKYVSGLMTIRTTYVKQLKIQEKTVAIIPKINTVTVMLNY
jgi:hypothetical protein